MNDQQQQPQLAQLQLQLINIKQLLTYARQLEGYLQVLQASIPSANRTAGTPELPESPAQTPPLHLHAGIPSPRKESNGKSNARSIEVIPQERRVCETKNKPELPVTNLPVTKLPEPPTCPHPSPSPARIPARIPARNINAIPQEGRICK